MPGSPTKANSSCAPGMPSLSLPFSKSDDDDDDDDDIDVGKEKGESIFGENGEGRRTLLTRKSESVSAHRPRRSWNTDGPFPIRSRDPGLLGPLSRLSACFPRR
uniref:Uncharacterized protein n=1 Tax=Trichuris muris TaxID=70415 RepID=A0A5S6R5F1_TRIMR